jgi:hypothetical protein
MYAVARNSRHVFPLVPLQAERVPGGWVAADRPADPGVGGEDQVAERLDERPLAIDGLVQRLRRQAAGPRHRLVPEPPEDFPRLAEAGRVFGAHPDPVGAPAVKLGLDQRADVDPVDGDVHDLAIDVDVDQLDAAHAYPGHVHPTEPGIGEIAGEELGTGQVRAVEPRSA